MRKPQNKVANRYARLASGRAPARKLPCVARQTSARRFAVWLHAVIPTSAMSPYRVAFHHRVDERSKLWSSDVHARTGACAAPLIEQSRERLESRGVDPNGRSLEPAIAAHLRPGDQVEAAGAWAIADRVNVSHDSSPVSSDV
jgi:hypothetical protein